MSVYQACSNCVSHLWKGWNTDVCDFTSTIMAVDVIMGSWSSCEIRNPDVSSPQLVRTEAQNHKLMLASAGILIALAVV